MLAPINSIKHYVQIENAVIASAAVGASEIVDAKEQNAQSAASDVVEGSVIKAIYLEIWIKSNASATEDTKFQLIIEKIPQAGVAPTFTEMNNLQTYKNKKNVLFFSQGVIGDGTTQAIPVVRQWFKIPKGKQRFGLDDRFLVTVSATAFAINRCGFAVYKEYK